MTGKEFVLKNWKKYDSINDLIEGAMKVCRCSPKQIKNTVYEKGLTNKFKKQLKRGNKKGVKIERISNKTKKISSSNHQGIAGLRKLFDKTQRIKDFIDNILKEKQWMFDYDVRDKVGISVSEWRGYSEQFASLQRVVKDRGITYKIWVHPDYIEEVEEFI